MTGTMVEDGTTYEVEDVRPGPDGLTIQVKGYGLCGDPNSQKEEDLIESVNWRNFKIACATAERARATTAMLTGKGEPTLWPNLITEYLLRLNHPKLIFPIIELQTNGIGIARGQIHDSYLERWYRLNLTTIGISVAHYDPKKNKEIYLGNKGSYPSLPKLIKKLHGFGFTVRLCCVAAVGYIDSANEVMNMVEFARDNNVEQLTVTPINAPTASEDAGAAEWTKKHKLQENIVRAIVEHLDRVGTRDRKLLHGGVVYDVSGQNICLNNCLSQEVGDERELRNLIFFPDGHLRPRWDLKGSIIF
jgi:molybdenum cofactor biosynthesis enzyme MoaA